MSLASDRGSWNLSARFPSTMRRRDFLSLAAANAALSSCAEGAGPSPRKKNHARAIAVVKRILPKLREDLAKKGLAPGEPVHLRFFKESSEMELWMRPPTSEEWKLFKEWKIARWSGKLGPKKEMGDGQTPEGFYYTNRDSLNPESRFHLSFDINYPNARDRALNLTGNLIMVHGSVYSIGCYAMTDPVIEEIYTLVSMAIAQGQTEVPIHCFPFRMKPSRMTKAEKSAEEAAHLAFWQQLEPAWRLFEETKRLPQITNDKGDYIVKPA
ncbi:MAG: L,D-transpeptidase family protein [Verrucomicrobiales bacterium]